METAVGDDKVGRFFLHQPCYHFRCQTSSVNGTPHMSVSVADLLWGLGIGPEARGGTTTSRASEINKFMSLLSMALPIENLSIITLDSWLSRGRG